MNSFSRPSTSSVSSIPPSRSASCRQRAMSVPPATVVASEQDVEPPHPAGAPRAGFSDHCHRRSAPRPGPHVPAHPGVLPGLVSPTARSWSASPLPPSGATAHSLREVFQCIVYQKTLLEMMQAGYLVNLRAVQVLLQADFDTLRTQHGDFVEAGVRDPAPRGQRPRAGARGVPSAGR